MGLRERLGLISGMERAQNAASRAIEQAGGVNLLVARARELQAQGDSTVLVAETRSGLSSHIMTQLHWGMVRRPYLAASWWDSYGVALEAFAQDGDHQAAPPTVRFTDGTSWSYLEVLAKDSTRLDNAVSRGRLDSGEAGLLTDGPEKLPLDFQLRLAMKLAQLQQDFRYGEGTASEAGRLKRDSRHRVIFP